MPQLPGFPFTPLGDKTPGGELVGYSTPYACQASLEMHMTTPTEQAKRLREMQQKWQATAQFFHECSSPASSPGVSSEVTKAYSPGEVLVKTAETPVTVCFDIPSESSTADVADSTPMSPEFGPVYVNEHSEVNTDPKINLEELPSMGSLGHDIGDCKPCAFFNTKGCGNGASCKFCHLCDAGEKKRRLKMKKAHFNALKQMEEFESVF